MGVLDQVKGRVEYGAQKAREGYTTYLGGRTGDRPVSTKRAVSEIRAGYFKYVHNPVVGGFTGQTVKPTKAAISKQQHKQKMAILKQEAKMIKLRRKAAKDGVDVAYEGSTFGNYELDFTGDKPEALRSTGYNIKDMFK